LLHPANTVTIAAEENIAPIDDKRMLSSLQKLSTVAIQLSARRARVDERI
jgi:hypothetical protein